MSGRLTFFIAAIILFASRSFAQLPCSTDIRYHELLQQYPQLAEYEKQFDEQLKRNLAKRTTALADTVTYDVPLVVHVVHDYGAENVSDDAIYTAVASWAKAYVKQNADTISVIPPFVPYIGNAHIRLHLATIDPAGRPTKGVVRMQSYLTYQGGDQAKYNDWPNNQYINIWLVGTFGAAYSGAAAYAYYPSSGASLPYYDGVICLANYINIEKTVPHELGHVLNLSHTWGSTNSPGVACGDDGVDDTPPTLGHMPGCGASALYDVTCATGYSVTYTSMSGLHDSVVNYPDTVNSQNIMDYTYCELMFTKGQVSRMRAALTAPTAGRNNLITPSNLEITGALQPMPDLPPVADYIVNGATGTAYLTDKRTYFLAFNNSGSFSFKNASWNDTVSDVLWTFSNGASTPSSTSMTTVDNQFSQPGWVTVSLVANSNAGTDTIVNTHAVYAADTLPAGGLGYTQPFAGAAAISNWPMFNFYNNQFKWEFYTGAGYGDSTCIRYRSYDTSARLTGIAIGDHDDIYTPAFNLAGFADSLFLDFYTAGASTSNGITGWGTNRGDSLEVDVTSSGGVQWTKLAGFNSAAIANNGDHNAEFVPVSPAQWKAQAISVPAFYRTRNTFFRFRYWPGNTGNNLYLDNFAIQPYRPSGVNRVAGAAHYFNVFPNPSANGCNLAFKTGNDGNISYCIKDLAGKVVYTQTKTLAPNTDVQEKISRSVIPVAGMYFITLSVDGVNMTQKMVVY